MQTTSNNSAETLLRLPQVEALVGLTRSSIYRAVKNQSFPAPVKLGAHQGARAVGFPASQVQKWISDRISGGQRKAQ